MLEQKILNINDDIVHDNKKLVECINLFMERIGQNSINTMKTYRRAVEMFFKDMRGKDICQLQSNDLIFEKIDIIKYQIELRKRFKSTTVNNRISIMKKIYEKLSEHGFPADPNLFVLERYDESDKESYDHMSNDEIKKAIDLVSKTRKGFEKSLLIKVAYSTAFRKRAIMNLKWSDIINHNGEWVLKALDKGNKWDYKKISKNLYSELMTLKSKSKSDRIFTITDKTINRMMEYIRDNIDFGDKNIVFHSLKKSSINEVALITNFDVKAMQRQGNHASATTTLNEYMAQKDLNDMVLVDIDTDVDLDVLNDLSKEQLLQIIKMSDRATQMKLINKVEHI